MGLPWWLSGKEFACQCRRLGFHPWIRKIPWRRKWQSTPVFLPKKSHGQRSLAGYNPWSHRVRHNWLSMHACNNRERSKENQGERNIQRRIGRQDKDSGPLSPLRGPDKSPPAGEDEPHPLHHLLKIIVEGKARGLWDDTDHHRTLILSETLGQQFLSFWSHNVTLKN